jgi:alcohol dehydrogenase
MEVNQRKVMKAWRLEKMGGRLELKEIPVPETRAGSVLVKVEATSLVSYMKKFVEGELPFYNPPAEEFTIGGNTIGEISAIGQDVWHLKTGQWVAVSLHITSHEQVAEPAMILIGFTGLGEQSAAVQADWRDGSLAEYILVPSDMVTPLDGLEHIPSSQLAVITRFVVPFGGFLRGRLSAGETLIVNGATGAFGTAAVILGLAMGAGRVIAAGRNEKILEAIAKIGGKRVVTIRLSGDVQADTAALRTASGGGAHIAFDMVGSAKDPNSTLAALYSLRREGRLVLMGSMLTDLPVPYTMLMLNGWEIIGNFMHPANAFQRLFDLMRGGLLDISAIQPEVFPLTALQEAMDAALEAGNFESVVITN